MLAKLASRALASATASVQNVKQARDDCRDMHAVQLQKLGGQRTQWLQTHDFWQLLLSAGALAQRQMQEWLVLGKSTTDKGD